MITLALVPATDTTISDVPDRWALYISIDRIIADVRTQRVSPQFRSLEHHTGEVTIVQPSLASLTWGGRQTTPKEIAEEWTSSISNSSARAASDPYSLYITTTHTRIALRPVWRPQIEDASTHEEIIAVLRMFGLDAIADRLVYLRSLADDDPDEPRMEIESLRALALFLMSERQLLDPRIGVTPDGLIQAEWRIPTNGILAMEFLSPSLIRFAAVSTPAGYDADRWRVNGTLPKGETMAAVQPFTEHIQLL